VKPSADNTGRSDGLALPDFLVIGAGKSGSTTLYEYLCRHPDVFMSEIKEPEFFSRDDVYEKGLDWYASLFADARPDQLRGEASTTYMRWPHTADASARIAETLPNAKLICILRHPVDRAYSHYCHHMRYEVTMTFEQALDEDDLFVDCSMYMDQLDRHLRLIPRESLLCLLFDDLRSDPSAMSAQMQRFLGLTEHNLNSQGSIQANKTSADHFIHAKTTHRLRQIPLLGRLADVVPHKWRRAIFYRVRNSPIGRRLAASYEIPAMLPETRAALVEQFREPNRRLAEFLGRDLSHWNQ